MEIPSAPFKNYLSISDATYSGVSTVEFMLSQNRSIELRLMLFEMVFVTSRIIEFRYKEYFTDTYTLCPVPNNLKKFLNINHDARKVVERFYLSSLPCRVVSWA